MPLVLRRANVSRPGGSWSEDDFDVFDGDRSVGRVYCVDAQAGNETWFWGVSFQLTGRKSYGLRGGSGAAQGVSLGTLGHPISMRASISAWLMHFHGLPVSRLTSPTPTLFLDPPPPRLDNWF